MTNEIASVQTELISMAWAAVKPHIGPLLLPTVTIMLMVQGTKLFVNPYLKAIGERRTSTIYRASAIVYGWMWLWLWPIFQNYLAGMGDGSWHVKPYPVELVLGGGIFLGILNVLAYDGIVKPLWKKFFKKGIK